MDEENSLRQRTIAQDKTPVQNDQQATKGPLISSDLPLVYNYGSSAEYAEAVRTWLWAYHNWQLSQCMLPFMRHHALVNSQSLLAQSGQRTDFNISTVQQRSPIVTNGAGLRCVIPSFGRRVLAETVDCLICFIICLLITFLLVEVGILNLDKYEKLLNNEADLKTFIDVTQDLFPLEIIKRLLTSIIEALYLSKGLGPVPVGRTPGKMIMGLKVIPCDSIYALSVRDHSVMVQCTTRTVSFANALLRSTIKNLALGFLFPLCVVLFSFRFNRSIYDLMAKTVVVED